jgi:hypothetical protein
MMAQATRIMAPFLASDAKHASMTPWIAAPCAKPDC